MKGSPSAWSPGAYPPPTTRGSRPGPGRQAPSPACGSRPLPLGLKPPRSAFSVHRWPTARPGWASPATVGKAEGFHTQPGQRPHFGSWLGPGPSAPQDGSGRCLWTLCEVGERRAPVPCSAGLVRRCPPVERGPHACHSLPPLSVLALRPWCLRGRREVRCQTRVRANPDPAPLKPRTQSPKRTRAHGAAAPRLCRLRRRRWGQRP